SSTLGPSRTSEPTSVPQLQGRSWRRLAERVDELRAAYAECERITSSHYENFGIGSWLLPAAERRHLAALYAFARGAGESAEPVFVATAHTIAERGLEVGELRALLRAFRYDADFRPYRDFAALRDYCRNSASPVGRLVLGLFGVRNPEADALSDEVCTGLQLANFWQDLSIDLSRGRSTLPLADLDAHPGARVAIERREANPAFRSLMQLQIERTRRSLRCGVELAALLPRRAAFEIHCFTGGGLAILEKVGAGIDDLLRVRPTLGALSRIRIFASALGPKAEARGPSAALSEVMRC
ncbi:MAG: squalene/phytoene synthase family protein, partial [bacterium]